MVSQDTTAEERNPMKREILQQYVTVANDILKRRGIDRVLELHHDGAPRKWSVMDGTIDMPSSHDLSHRLDYAEMLEYLEGLSDALDLTSDNAFTRLLSALLEKGSEPISTGRLGAGLQDYAHMPPEMRGELAAVNLYYIVLDLLTVTGMTTEHAAFAAQWKNIYQPYCDRKNGDLQ
jgi:hypothetical protein